MVAIPLAERCVVGALPCPPSSFPRHRGDVYDAARPPFRYQTGRSRAAAGQTSPNERSLLTAVGTPRIVRCLNLVHEVRISFRRRGAALGVLRACVSSATGPQQAPGQVPPLPLGEHRRARQCRGGDSLGCPQTERSCDCDFQIHDSFLPAAG